MNSRVRRVQITCILPSWTFTRAQAVLVWFGLVCRCKIRKIVCFFLLSNNDMFFLCGWIKLWIIWHVCYIFLSCFNGRVKQVSYMFVVLMIIKLWLNLTCRWDVQYVCRTGKWSGWEVYCASNSLEFAMIIRILGKMKRICFVLIVIFVFASTVCLLVLTAAAFIVVSKSADMFIMMLCVFKIFRNFSIVLRSKWVLIIQH